MILIRENQYGEIDLARHPTLRRFPLRRVGGALELRGCKLLRSLPGTLEVGWSLDLDGCCSLTRLPTTLQVRGTMWLMSTSVTELPDDLEVGGDLYLWGSKVTHVPKSARIGGVAIGLGKP